MARPRTRDEITRNLTTNERAFIREYLKDNNGARAYRVAFKKPKDKNASTRAKKLLADPRIKKELKIRFDEIEDALEEKWRIDHDAIKQRLATIGFTDLKDVVTWKQDDDGNIRMNLKDADVIKARNHGAIESIKIRRNRIESRSDDDDIIYNETFEFKLRNANDALKTLAQMSGGMPDDKNAVVNTNVVVYLPSNGREVKKKKQ